jgi:hypothetical protein
MMLLPASLVGKDAFSRNFGRRLGDEPADKPGRLPIACRLVSVFRCRVRGHVHGIIDSIGNDVAIGLAIAGKNASAGFSTVSVIGV